MIKDHKDWTEALREVSISPGSPIIQKNGKWEVQRRKETWTEVAPRIFDDHLEKVRRIAVDVLREVDPQFELKPEDRFAAAIYDKVLKHSRMLRQGLAETLALAGSFPSLLKSASHARGEDTATLAVRAILKDADWLLWASLNDCLPTLAEAAPNEFLDAVERALNQKPSPFLQVFKQESGGFGGRTYTTGLLWGLEALAWHPDYLSRVTVVLGGLAALDPGGNWANRPANSLVAIYLPWHPQTTAGIPKRKSAIETLLKEHPAIGWQLLLKLLPSETSTTSGTYKPRWRPLVPDAWKETVLKKDYWEQIAGYSELAVSMAEKDPSKLLELVADLPNLPEPSHTRFLGYLSSPAIARLSGKERQPIWEALVELIAEHRKFSDAKWALPADSLEKIEAVATKLAPSEPALRLRRLFGSRPWDLYERGEGIEGQEKKLADKQRAAATEVFETSGLRGIQSFAESVDSAWSLGIAFGHVAPENVDAKMLPKQLRSNDKPARDLAGGFVVGRFQAKQWAWVDEILSRKWTAGEKVDLLLVLPFERETWIRADNLGKSADAYWKNVNTLRGGEKENLLEATQKLVAHGRPKAALECLDRLLYYKIPFEPDLAARVLMDALTVEEPFPRLDVHDVGELITWLQRNPPKDEGLLIKIEWNYLPLLGRHRAAKPAVLAKHLSTSPEFFCEVMAAAFRAEGTPASTEMTEGQKAKAENAHHLLQEWTQVPGQTPDGKFDEKLFAKWVADVMRLAAESGRLAIAQHLIGQVLFYAPADPSGLWMHKAVAEVLNAKDAEDMRSGYTNKLFNMRGVYSPSGGNEERALAEKYQKRAEALDASGYQRIAGALRGVAKEYERDADREAASRPHAAEGPQD